MIHTLMRAWPALLLLIAIGTASAQQQITLHWQRPAWNADGSALADTAGFKVYHGLSSGEYSDVHHVGDVTETVLTDLQGSGPHYFAVTSYDSTGTESALSGEVSWMAEQSPHTVSLERPADGATYVSPATVELLASVTENGHTIRFVAFYNDDTLLNVDDVAPYTYTWTEVPTGSYWLRAVAVDTADLAVTSAVSTVVISDPNYAPSFITDPIAAPNAIAGEAYTADLAGQATDPDTGDVLVYSKISGPEWLTVGVDGRLSGRPTDSDIGSNSFAVRVADQAGMYDEAALSIRVDDPKTPGLTITISWVRPRWNVDGSALQDLAGFKLYHGGASDVYSHTHDVGNVTQATVTERVGDGSQYFAVTAYDRDGVESALSEEIVWTDRPAPLHEVTLTEPADGTIFSAPAGVALAATVVTNGHTIERVTFRNNGMLLHADTETPYTYAWMNVPAGTFVLTAVAYDSNGTAVTSSVSTITVINPNHPPEFVTDPVIATDATAGQSYTADISGSATDSDPDDVLIYSKLSGPEWLTVSGNGELWGSPAEDDAGLNAFAVRVTDPHGLSDTATLTITVQPSPVKELPAPWQLTDVGTIPIPGAAVHSNGTFRVQGSGQGLYRPASEFSFVYQMMTADGDIVARVRAMDQTSDKAMAGILIHDDLTATSPFIAACVLGTGEVCAMYRKTSGSRIKDTRIAGNPAPDNWLRIVRNNKVFTVHHSSDGFTWTQIGSSTVIGMSQTVYVGLVTASGLDNGATFAVFDNTMVVP